MPPAANMHQARIRCFVAVDTPGWLKVQLGDLMARLKIHEGGRKVRWVRPDGLHVTLKFLGDVATEKVPQIEAAVLSALSEPRLSAFDLSLSGLGSFGTPNAPHVIWLGLNGNRPALSQLQATIEEALNPLGFLPDQRGFNPHLTLGYLPKLHREEVGALNDLLAQPPIELKGQFGPFSVTEAVLMQSDLRPSGAIYTPLKHFPFVNQIF